MFLERYFFAILARLLDVDERATIGRLDRDLIFE